MSFDIKYHVKSKLQFNTRKCFPKDLCTTGNKTSKNRHSVFSRKNHESKNQTKICRQKFINNIILG